MNHCLRYAGKVIENIGGKTSGLLTDKGTPYQEKGKSVAVGTHLFADGLFNDGLDEGCILAMDTLPDRFFKECSTDLGNTQSFLFSQALYLCFN